MTRSKSKSASSNNSSEVIGKTSSSDMFRSSGEDTRGRKRKRNHHIDSHETGQVDFVGAMAATIEVPASSLKPK